MSHAIARDISVDPSSPQQIFQGWGTSLCWWAHVAGGYAEPARTQLMDDIFDPVKGLGLNVVRYNIGGGENGRDNFLQYRCRVPGFSSAPGKYDWTADANQRIVLAEAIKRGADQLEAFSNSPPYWMTQSGSVTGARRGNNLRDDQYDAFADYLAEVVKHFRDAWHVDFKTLDPMNEPAAGWWTHGKWQEGCNFDRPAQNKILGATARALRARGLKTILSASDENNIDDAVRSFDSYSDPVKALVGQINTHSYAGSQRVRLNNTAAANGKHLWLSEYGDNDRSGMEMARVICADMKLLRPSTWSTWQVADSHPDWGLYFSPLENETDTAWRKNEKYFIYAQYTKFIRPGYRMIPAGDDHTLAAYDAKSSTLVIVALNDQRDAENVSFDVSKFDVTNAKAAARRTSTSEQLATVNVPPPAYAWPVALPAQSVTTFVLTGVKVIAKPIIDGTATYRIIAADGKFALDIADVADGSAVTAAKPIATNLRQQWGVVAVGGGEYLLVSRAAGAVVDVPGASTDANKPLILFTASAGPNQRWHLESAEKSGQFRLKNVNSNQYLDVANGVAIQSNVKPRAWMFTPVAQPKQR